MKNENSRSRTALTVLAAAALAVGHFLWAGNFWTGVYLAVRSNLPTLAAVVAVVAAFGTPMVVLSVRDRLDERANRYRPAPLGLIEWSVGAVSVAVAGAVVFAAVVSRYEADLVRGEQLSFSTEEAPGFEPRFPLVVAEKLLPRSAGDQENIRVDAAVYTDPTRGEWAAQMAGVSALRPSEGVLVKSGDTYTVCTWPKAQAGSVAVAMGDGGVGARSGALGNDLSRQLRRVQRWTQPRWDGVGAWCDADGGAWMLVPATRPEGVWRVRHVPAGVWVIDPSGTIVWDEEVAPGEYPVPVIDAETASEMVDANRRFRRDGSEAGWRSVFFRGARVGLERPESGSFWTESEEDAADNPDWGNAGEFLLLSDEGRWLYVTPLTPLGASETVVALAVVEADRMVPGVLPATTIHRLPEQLQRISNLEVAKLLRVEFDTDVQWEAGYSLYELAPLADGFWTATIGQSLQPKYRAVLAPDGSVCLNLFTSGERVRCTGESLVAAPASSGGSTPSVGDLGELSEQELLDLLEGIAEELRSRG